jgi:hypothetical membrane protein
MRHGTARDSISVYALGIGVAVPLLYYGSQAAAAPYFPGFSFVGTIASELGSDHSKHAAVFNVGILIQGTASLVASLGFLHAFRRLGVPPILSGTTSLAVALAGVKMLWAGFFPLPDPRHGGHPAFLVSMLALPPLLAAAMWRVGSGATRAYFLVNLVLFAVMSPISSGAAGLDTHDYRGLLQRVFTLTIFPPIGVAAYTLIRRR